MPGKKPIPAAERRRQDYLRRRTLKIGSVYGSRLARARRAELRRVLALARDLDDPEALGPLLEISLDESGYLPGWWEGLWLTAGVPIAKTTAAISRCYRHVETIAIVTICKCHSFFSFLKGSEK